MSISFLYHRQIIFLFNECKGTNFPPHLAEDCQIIPVFGGLYVLLQGNKRIGKRTSKNNGSPKLLKINRGYKVAKLE